MLYSELKQRLDRIDWLDQADSRGEKLETAQELGLADRKALDNLKNRMDIAADLEKTLNMIIQT